MAATNSTFLFQTSTSGEYDWSQAANWSNGTPQNQLSSFALSFPSAPGGNAIALDDIANLAVNQLSIASGVTVAVTGGNSLEIQGALAGVPNYGSGQVALSGTNTTLQFDSPSPFANTVGISLSGSNESLVLLNAGSGTDTGAVTGFAATDSIDFRYFSSISSVVLNAGTLTVSGISPLGPRYPEAFTFTNFGTVGPVSFTTVTDSHGGTLVEALCFAAGTSLLTPSGERLVEDLQEGDLVLTQDGETATPRPITWVGRMRVDLARHPRPENAAPIRIRRGAFADSVPHRDLLLSPEHCILADGRLIAAKCLVNGTTIVQDLDRPAIEYFHIETAPHSVVLAEGLPAETYLDTGNRSFFDNAGAALVLHPEFHINTAFRRWNTDSCAPLAATPAEIEPTWRRLAARAESLGHAAPVLLTTSDAAPRLLVQGRAIAPIEADATRLVFLLPEGAADATLVSRFGSPADTAPYLNDHRRLGIAIRHMVLRAGAEERIVPADHPGLTRGWHPVERDEAGSTWRWTEGRAHLPLGPLSGPAVLELHLAGAMNYRIDAPEPARQAA